MGSRSMHRRISQRKARSARGVVFSEHVKERQGGIKMISYFWEQHYPMEMDKIVHALEAFAMP